MAAICGRTTEAPEPPPLGEEMSPSPGVDEDLFGLVKVKAGAEKG